jgi:RHH-type rel operon transcriptional repressor/antitoxin RelB
LSIRLPRAIDRRLSALARKTRRTKSQYVREAVIRFLEDEEDRRVALARLEQRRKRLSVKDVKAALGLDD